MNLIVNTKTLVTALLRVSTLTKATTLSILENAKIEHDGYDLYVTATDLQTSITVKVKAENSGSGETICVSHKDVTELLKAIKDPAVVLTVDDRGKLLEVKSKKGNYTLGLAPVKDFPKPPKAAAGEPTYLPASAVKAGLSNTIYALAEGTATNMAMTGVYLEIGLSDVRITATNGAKLSSYAVQLEDTGGEANVIIPGNAARELLKLIGDLEDEMLQVFVTEAHMFVNAKAVSFTCRFIDARFPKYRAVIPEQSTNMLQIGAEELTQALARLRVLASEDCPIVVMEVGEDTLSLSAEAKEVSKAGRDVIDLIAGYSGTPLKIQFNAIMLAETLTTIGGEIRIFFMNNRMPARIEPAEQLDMFEHVTILTPFVPNN